MYLYSVKQVLCKQRDERRHPSLPEMTEADLNILIPQIRTPATNKYRFFFFRIYLNIFVNQEARFQRVICGDESKKNKTTSRNQEGDCVILSAKTCCSLPGCDLDATDKRDFLELLVSLFVCLLAGKQFALVFCLFFWVTQLSTHYDTVSVKTI